MKEVAVIGAGQMGSGIAQIFATAGYPVRVMDVSENAFEKSRNRIADSLEKLASKGNLDKTPREIQSLISYSRSIVDLRGCSIFVESAFEDFNIKNDLFRRLAQIIRPGTKVASNTSSYSITSFAKLLPYPENFIGFHFMNPPPIMNLIEIIRGYHTSDETFQFFWDLALELKKVPVASKNSPGFVLNRILIPMINEAIYVLQEGIASAEGIDEAMKLGANHPIGPLALADLIGLDTVLAILHTLEKELGETKYAPCPLLKDYVAAGRLGCKTKRGFYKY